MNSTPAKPDNSASSPMTVHFIGNILTFRARYADTRGSFTVIEVLTAPNAGPPPHTQTDQEAFLILEGRYEITVGNETKICGPGDFVHVAPGTMHAFRNISDVPSKLLLINLPGDLHEEFFVAVGEPLPPGTTAFPEMLPPDIPRIVETAARFGIDIPLAPAA